MLFYWVFIQMNENWGIAKTSLDLQTPEPLNLLIPVRRTLFVDLSIIGQNESIRSEFHRPWTDPRTEKNTKD